MFEKLLRWVLCLLMLGLISVVFGFFLFIAFMSGGF